MAETKHTPGPWSSFNEFGNRGACFASDDETMIAFIKRPYPHETFKVPSHDVCDANFRLIDAAPDLLAVARMCAELAERYGEQGELVRAARAAIAKAEGRSGD